MSYKRIIGHVSGLSMSAITFFEIIVSPLYVSTVLIHTRPSALFACAAILVPTIKRKKYANLYMAIIEYLSYLSKEMRLTSISKFVNVKIGLKHTWTIDINRVHVLVFSHRIIS